MLAPPAVSDAASRLTLQRRSETYSRDQATLCYLCSLFPWRVAQRTAAARSRNSGQYTVLFPIFAGIKGDIVDVSLVTMELGNEGSTLTAVLSKNDEKTLITLFQLPNSIVEKSM